MGLHAGRALRAVPVRPMSSAGVTAELRVHLSMAEWG